MDCERVKEIAKIVREQTGADPGTEHIIEGALLSVLYRAAKDVEDQCLKLVARDVTLKHPVNSIKEIALVAGYKKADAHRRIKEISDGT